MCELAGLPGSARLGQAVRLDVNTVSHFVPHVVVAQLFVVLRVGLRAARLHGDVLSLLHERVCTQRGVCRCETACISQLANEMCSIISGKVVCDFT